MSFLDRIHTCNQFDISKFTPFLVDSRLAGWIRHGFKEHLAQAPEVFKVTDASVSFANKLTSPPMRSSAVAALADDWVAEGLIPKLRNELYPVRQAWSDPDLLQMDRGLAPLFGVRAYGVHLNGYIKRPDGYHLWIGRRSADRSVEPDKLDNMVAGGQPAHLSLMDNLVKECEEEAGLPRGLAEQSVPVGTVSYCFETETGLKRDTLFCYDLAVPETFRPDNKDGEIADFRLMPLSRALDLIRDGATFKFNVSLVVLDFAIRHGVLSPDREPDYEAILEGIHRPGPV